MPGLGRDLIVTYLASWPNWRRKREQSFHSCVVSIQATVPKSSLSLIYADVLETTSCYSLQDPLGSFVSY